MSFTLIREERITQSGDGLQLEYDFFIKLDTAFDELLPQLADKELHAYIHISLREAFASSGLGDPATLKTIAHACGKLSERQTQRIVKTLLAKTLIAEAGMSPQTREKFYRPIGYAWFGKRTAAQRVTPMTPPTRLQGDKGDIRQGGDIVVVDVVQTPNQVSRQQQFTVTLKILQECGVMGKPLQVLSENVEPEIAELWLAWIQNAPSYLRNPVGIVVNALLADPDARPAVSPNKETRRARKSKITGRLAPAKETS